MALVVAFRRKRIFHIIHGMSSGNFRYHAHVSCIHGLVSNWSVKLRDRKSLGVVDLRTKPCPLRYACSTLAYPLA